MRVYPGMCRQFSILQLQFHTISQFLKFGIREPIRFRLGSDGTPRRTSSATSRRGHESNGLVYTNYPNPAFVQRPGSDLPVM
jgi:hypothetical protein